MATKPALQEKVVAGLLIPLAIADVSSFLVATVYFTTDQSLDLESAISVGLHHHSVFTVANTDKEYRYGHSIALTLLPLPRALALNPAAWNQLIWGNVGITSGLFFMR